MRRPQVNEIKTRGRLKTVERLPPAADGAVAWAITEIRGGRLTQMEILAGLNKRLAVLGLERIARSSFNRFVNDGVRNGFVVRCTVAAPTAPAAFLCPHCGTPLVVTTRGGK